MTHEYLRPDEVHVPSPPMKERFMLFARNGRWGTCSDCPRDEAGMAYPERCNNTMLPPHHLGIDALVASYKLEAAKGT